MYIYVVYAERNSVTFQEKKIIQYFHPKDNSIIQPYNISNVIMQPDDNIGVIVQLDDNIIEVIIWQDDNIDHYFCKDSKIVANLSVNIWLNDNIILDI